MTPEQKQQAKEMASYIRKGLRARTTREVRSFFMFPDNSGLPVSKGNLLGCCAVGLGCAGKYGAAKAWELKNKRRQDFSEASTLMATMLEMPISFISKISQMHYSENKPASEIADLLETQPELFF